MPATPATQATVWIDKEAVARRLKISERSANDLAAKGEIKAEKRRSRESNQVVWMFDPADVERYAQDRDKPVPTAILKQALQGRQVKELPASPAADTVNPYSMPTITPRPWLTLEEAAEFSGLTKRWLMDESEREPKIVVRDMGTGSRGGRWRFHRESLERA